MRPSAFHDAFRVFLGGRLGNEAQFAKPLDGRFLHSEIHTTLEKLFKFYLDKKQDSEEFRTFVDRLGLEEIQAKALAGCK